MAMCNARQQPTIVDIVDSARQRNGSVYNNSNLGYATENKQLKHRGKKKELKHSQRILTHVFVGDDAFGLKLHMIKLYPYLIHRKVSQLINEFCHFSRTPRITENLFGIYASSFCAIRQSIIGSPKKVVLITKAIVALQNFLISITEDNHATALSTLSIKMDQTI